MNTGSEQQPSFIRQLLAGLCSAHPDCELIETHISWVLLAGEHAYKIKKPVDLGFLDFSTLEKRRHYCEEEQRLNRRLAPTIYQEVLPVTGSEQRPVLGGTGEPFDYAVKMRRFPQSAQLDHQLAQGELGEGKLLAVAQMIADFHKTAEVAGPDSHHGEPEKIVAPVRENFSQLAQHHDDPATRPLLAELERWSEDRYRTLYPLLQQRKADGFIRECHGDLHLRNLAWVDDAPLAFDCLEFDPELRWIDVISELSFLAMDLDSRGEADLANLVLNRYLEQTGDYAGCRLLPFYLCYRAMVRAKVEAIRAGQPGIAEAVRLAAEQAFNGYLALARRYAGPSHARLLISHGLSASGKSTLSAPLCRALGAIRIRSDVERKRLMGMAAGERGTDAVGKGIYTASVSERTYGRLADLARPVLQAGLPVLIDATFLDVAQRQRFRQLASELDIPFHILCFTARPATLRQRIRQRRHDASDADLAVLEHQLANYQPLRQDELPRAIVIDTERPFDAGALASQLSAGSD